MNTIFTTVNWAQAFVEYSPLTFGTGSEPAISIASMIRNSMMNAPMTWPWNRFEDFSITTTTVDQDYEVDLTNFGFLERVSLTDANGKTQELKEVYNTTALAKNSVQQRPSAVAVILNNPGTDITIRFNSVPDQIYTVTLTYQGLATQFGPFTTNSAANAFGGNTSYTGIFTPISFPINSVAAISGFTNAGNNGSFLVVSCTGTILTVQNAGGISETPAVAATAINGSWAPIPDQYSDVYNNLFLAEAFQSVSEDAQATRYRQRGIAALLAKAEGLTQTQINVFRQQWLARDAEVTAAALKTQQGTQARGV